MSIMDEMDTQPGASTLHQPGQRHFLDARPLPGEQADALCLPHHPGPAAVLETFTRETALETVNERRYAYVPLPHRGKQARVQSLISGEVDAYEEGGFKGHGQKMKVNFRDARAKLAALGWVDESGARLFRPASPDDIAELSRMDGGDISKICRKIRELSGMKADLEDEDEEGK